LNAALHLRGGDYDAERSKHAARRTVPPPTDSWLPYQRSELRANHDQGRPENEPDRDVNAAHQLMPIMRVAPLAPLPSLPAPLSPFHPAVSRSFDAAVGLPFALQFHTRRWTHRRAQRAPGSRRSRPPTLLHSEGRADQPRQLAPARVATSRRGRRHRPACAHLRPARTFAGVVSAACSTPSTPRALRRHRHEPANTSRACHEHPPPCPPDSKVPVSREMGRRERRDSNPRPPA
jgi:hypothetical protein